MPKSKAQLELEAIQDSVSESVFFKVQESKVQFLANLQKERLGGIHVTTWNKKCPRNKYYSSLEKKDEYTIDAEQFSHFYFGHLIHGSTDLGGKLHEHTMIYDFVNDKVIPIEDIKSNKFKFTEENKWDIVVGTNDDLISIETVQPFGNIIVDKKTYNSNNYTPREASEDYILQLNLYRLLINKCKLIDAAYGTIAYIDIATKGLKHVEFTEVLQAPEETLKYLQEERKTILQSKLKGELPPRKQTWLCDGYCPHFYRCMLNK